MNTPQAKFQLLIVDDDPLVLESLPLAIPENWQPHAFNSPSKIQWNIHYEAALVDLHYSSEQGAEGLKVISHAHEQNPHLEIIAMSGDLSRELMEKCLKAGASRFLAKPISPEEIQLTLEKIESYILLRQASIRSQLNSIHWVGDCAKSQTIKKKIAELKGEPGPILLEGESGTGKEVVAHLLHQQNQGPFIAINVAAIPENLFESEFFGHMKGAFTGADQNKMGLAEAANGGTLFIDEIEALPLKMQVKLLRFLESGEVKRVGSKQAVHVKCRVIVATNKNLENMVQNNEFREDLLWRINGHKLLLPPLRERHEDIPQLCKHFFAQDRIRRKTLSEDAIASLKDYQWPGNIRELRRCCEQLIVTSPLPIVRHEDVQKVIAPHPQKMNSTPIKIDLSLGLNALVSQYEAQIIANTLEQYKDIDEVARALKISRSSLYKKIKDYDIDWRN